MSHKLGVEGLSAAYRGRVVLSSASLTADSGELTALLGRNGSGKTTLLRVISGVLQADRGRIRLDDCSLLGLSRVELAKRVAYVPQLASPPAHLSVTEAVHLCSRDAEGARTAIGMLALDQLADKRCDEISGGEWRRVLVAQGLAQLPPNGGLLLLDEPLAYIDAPGRRELLSQLRQVAIEREAICLLAMHEIELGATCCRSAVLLERGTVACSGEFGEVAARATAPELALVAEVA